MTEQERLDERIYQERRCFFCLEPVTAKHAIWRLGSTAGQRFLFHDACQRRFAKSQPQATLVELLCVMRERREMQARWEAK